MKIGPLERKLPMRIDPIDEEAGLYNIYAPGSLDIDYCKELIEHPKEGVKYYNIYSEKGDRWNSFVKTMCEYYNIKYYRFEEPDGLVHYIVDLYDGISKIKGEQE